jgi:hypothetical protein
MLRGAEILLAATAAAMASSTTTLPLTPKNYNVSGSVKNLLLLLS